MKFISKFLIFVTIFSFIFSSFDISAYAESQLDQTAMILFQGDNIAISGKPYRYAKVWFKGDKVNKLHMGVVCCSDYVVYLPYYIASPDEMQANPDNILVGSYTFNHNYLANEHQDGLDYPDSFQPQAYSPLYFWNTNINVDGGTVYCIGMFGYDEKYLAETPKITEDNFKVRFDGFASVKKIDVNSKWSDSMMRQYIMWLTDGESASNFITDVNGNIYNGAFYDLEVPLNFKMRQKSLLDLGFIELGKDDPLYLSWEQSDPNYTKWTTEIYISVKGTSKKHWYSLKEDKFDIDFFHYTDVNCYKLKYTFDISKDTKLDPLIKEQVGDFFSCSGKTSFMIRNKYVDDDEIVHYSNYVYIDNRTESSAGSDYEFNGYEIDGNKFDNLDGSLEERIPSSIDPSSGTYDGGSVNASDTSAAGSLSVMKSVFNEVKAFPSFFGSVLSFLPESIITVFSAAIILSIGIALIKLAF